MLWGIHRPAEFGSNVRLCIDTEPKIPGFDVLSGNLAIHYSRMVNSAHATAIGHHCHAETSIDRA
jgi:hypothetical protein